MKVTGIGAQRLAPTFGVTKPAGDIQRQQLFFWMGRSIDEWNGKRKLLRDELMSTVLRQLRGIRW